MDQAIQALKRGQVVVFPTDTVTGMGCRAGDARAVRKIFALKGRSQRKSLILFVGSIAEAESYSGKLAPRVRRLLRLLWPGAFTAVLPLRKKVPAGIGIRGTVGIRMPGHRVARGLVRKLGEALATTSANRTRQTPDPDARQASCSWGGRVAFVSGVSGETPSTVADLTSWPPAILRPGAVSEQRLHRLVSRISGRP